MRVLAGKKSKQLPSRTGLKQLGQTQRTLTDYSKASPLTPTEPTANIMQNLQKVRK
jgi:hypothetical protein